ncbi:MAG: excinuclease ABC subunit UvrA, partial [Methanobacterium sp.]
MNAKKDNIVIKGAREHNLKNINVIIPRDKLIVISGISGSGKSSLAFDTIYAEGQRRYVESLSAYARQFLGQMKKPEIDYIEGLSPAISIDQKTTKMNPRSTVGTVTEIYDYLRLLYARIGIPHCYNCGKPIAQQTSGQIVDNIYKEDEKTKIQILAPVVKDRKGENHKLLEDLKKKGFVRVRVDGEILSLDDDINMDKNKKHSVEVVVDRLVIRYDVDFKRRLADSVETALELGEGLIIILYQENDENYEKVFSEHFACTECGINFEEISPRTFSFNSPHGACSTCNGLGSKLEIDTDLVIPDKSLSLEEGAILPWSKSKKRNNYYTQMLKAVGDHYDFSMDTPFNELPKKYQNIILYGSSERVDFTFRRRNRMHHVRRKFEGVVKRMERLFMDTKSNYMRGYIGQFMSDRKCPACNGTRLRPESRSVTVGDKSISTVSSLPIKESKNFFEELKLTEMEGFIAK